MQSENSAYKRGSGHPVDQNLSGRGDLLLGDHGSGLVELVVAGTLEEIGVGAMGLGVGGVEQVGVIFESTTFCCPFRNNNRRDCVRREHSLFVRKTKVTLVQYDKQSRLP